MHTCYLVFRVQGNFKIEICNCRILKEESNKCLMFQRPKFLTESLPSLCKKCHGLTIWASELQTIITDLQYIF